MPVFARTTLAGAIAVATSLAAAPAVTQPVQPARAAQPEARPGASRFSVGGDLQFVLPVSTMRDVTGPPVGALARVGVIVAPNLEVTGRVGFLHGLESERNGVSRRMSVLPVWGGARWFFFGAGEGPYVAGEVALNALFFDFRFGGEVAAETSQREARLGWNAGAGWVPSRKLPIDVRVQFMHLNLLGVEPREKALFGVGGSVGYAVWL